MKIEMMKKMKSRSLIRTCGCDEQLPDGHRRQMHPPYCLRGDCTGVGRGGRGRGHVERGRGRGQQRSQNEPTTFLTTLRLSHISRPLLFSI